MNERKQGRKEYKRSLMHCKNVRKEKEEKLNEQIN